MRPKKYKTEVERLLVSKLNALRSRCKNGRKKAIHKGPATPFNLTPEWIFEQYRIQKGRCFYTGIKIRLKTSGNGRPMWNSLSVDRIDNKKGYLIGNVVLAINKVNTVKNGFDNNESQIIDKVYNKKFLQQLEKVKSAVKEGKSIIKP